FTRQPDGRGLLARGDRGSLRLRAGERPRDDLRRSVRGLDLRRRRTRLPRFLPGHGGADDLRVYAVEDLFDDRLARGLRDRPEAVAGGDEVLRPLLDPRRLDADR